RIVAAHLIDRPGLPVARLVDELRTGNLLSALAADDEQTAVRTAFDLSYQALPAEAQRLFRLLGMVPGPEVTAEAAAALASTTAGDAAAQAAAELSLCVARIRQDRHRQGAHHAARARQYAHAAGWLAGECAARNNLALIAVRIGALAEAVDHLTWVLDATSNPDNTVSRLAPLQNLGTVYYDRGDLATALDLYQ